MLKRGNQCYPEIPLVTNSDKERKNNKKKKWKKRKNVSFKTIPGLFTYVFSVLEIRYLQIPTVL